MSNLSQFFNAGGGFYEQRLIHTTSTFTAPVTADYLVTAIGAGGSGSSAKDPGNRHGGGAGGFSQRIIRLSAGQTLTCTIGAGGAAVGVYSQSYTTSWIGYYTAAATTMGVNGGATTVVGGGYTLTANGGSGGTLDNGGSGGTATGGTTNVTGGAGGTALGTAWWTNAGGGSVGVYGVGYNGGSSTTSAAGWAAGAGVGGSVSGSYTFDMSQYGLNMQVPSTALMPAYRVAEILQNAGNDLKLEGNSGQVLTLESYQGNMVVTGGSLVNAGSERLLAPRGGIALYRIDTSSAYTYLVGSTPGTGGCPGINYGKGGLFAGGAPNAIAASEVNIGYGAGGYLGGGGGSGGGTFSTSATSYNSATNVQMPSGPGGDGGVIIEWFNK